MTDPKELFEEAHELARVWCCAMTSKPAEVRRFLVTLVAAQIISTSSIESIEQIQGDDFDLESVYSIYCKMLAHASESMHFSLEVLQSNFPLPAKSEAPAVSSLAVAALRLADGERERCASWLLTAAAMIRDVDEKEDFTPEELSRARLLAQRILRDMEEHVALPEISSLGGEA